MINRTRMGWSVWWMGLISLMLCGGLGAQVTRAFVSRYNGPANADDDARALKIDAEGNVYVTGRSAGVGTGMDFLTIKYNPHGEELWVCRYDGPGHGEDSARALAIDAEGNVYVTGESLGVETGMDYATIKYDRDGNEIWVQRYDGPEHNQDYAVAVAVDREGRVYVTGFSKSEASKFDFITIAYDGDGNEIWVQRWDGEDHDDDIPAAIAVDHHGNVFVTGTTESDDTRYDYVTIKYSSDGTEQWVQIYNDPYDDDDLPWAVTTDAQGNCYVTGQSTGSTGYFDFVTLKYAPDGTPMWAARYNANGERTEDNSARAVAVDGHGFVYVTGSSVKDGLSDFATVKYGPDGTEIWSQMYRGPGIGINIATAVVVDRHGNVYITGRSTGDGTGPDYATIKYNAHGAQQWVDRYNGPGNWEDSPNAMAMDAHGNLYVAGASVGLGSGFDYATIKYTQP